MKNIKLISFILCAGVALLAAVTAFLVGDKSDLYLSGEIVITPSLQEKAQGIQTIFIILRDADSQMPMPYGAYRDRIDFTRNKTYSFTLTKEKLQLMNPQAPVPKTFNLKVRLDRDGLGGMDTPGDLVGKKKMVAFGTSNVRLEIDKEI